MAEWPVPTRFDPDDRSTWPENELQVLRAAYKDRDRWKAEWQAAGFEAGRPACSR